MYRMHWHKPAMMQIDIIFLGFTIRAIHHVLSNELKIHSFLGDEWLVENVAAIAN